MTRFARSKGSKSSNERIPEQATSWEVMRKQLHDVQSNKDDSSKRAEFEEIRKQNYEKFLKEEVAKKTEQSWCEFPSNPTEKILTPSKTESKNKKKKKNRSSLVSDEAQIDVGDSEKSLDVDDVELSKWCDDHSDGETNERYKQLASQLEILCQNEGKKKPKDKKKVSSGNDNEQASDSLNLCSIKTQNNDDKTSAPQVEKKKKRKSKSKKTSQENSSNVLQQSKNETQNEMQNSKSPKKRKLKDEETNSEVLSSTGEPIHSNHSKDLSHGDLKKSKKSKKRKLMDDETNTVTPINTVNPSNSTGDMLKKKKKKNRKNDSTTEISADDGGKINQKIPANNPNSKKKDKKEFARRKPVDEGKNTIFVNGEEVEISTLHGFPITSKDYQRIQELRKNLVSKGIPKSEVERTIKLERRRAEKTLARLKKNICFHCRKGGHMLSECPELTGDGVSNTAMPSSGLCFKCGSTEHTHFQCKVVRTQDYKFAQCFICKEQGHISRHCPDNPRGIYPKGGACRVCGDVTHLKKDCPQILQQREDDTIRLETLQSDNVEDIGDLAQKATKVAVTPKIKHVKF